MGKYVENNLGKGETIVKKAELNPAALVGAWIFGILFCWLLLIPLIKAIIATVQFNHVELAVTSKRVVGKVGVIKTKTMDAPLSRVQNVSISQKFLGKLFNYSLVKIDTAAGQYTFDYIKNANAFKGTLMAQIEQAETDKMQQQAELMARSMAGVINK